MKEYPREFEEVHSEESYRLAVLGGWHHVFLCWANGYKGGNIASSIFISDPNHEWLLEPKNEKNE